MSLLELTANSPDFPLLRPYTKLISHCGPLMASRLVNQFVLRARLATLMTQAHTLDAVESFEKDKGQSNFYAFPMNIH